MSDAAADASGDPADPSVLGRRELQDRAIRGASWTIIHTATSIPIAFIVNILLARTLGVVHYGRLAFLMTLMDVVGGIVALGVTNGTIQFGAKAHAAGRRDEVRKLLSQAQGFRLAFVAPVLTVVVLLSAHVATPMLVLAVVFGVWVPGLLDGAMTCLAIENKTASGAKNAMLANLLTQAGVVLALLLGGNADAVWVTRLALGSVAIGLALLVVDRSYRAAVLRPRLPRHMPVGFWRFVGPTAAGSLISTLVLSRSEVFFLQWFGDAAEVGYFALAFGLASHIFAPAQALLGPLVPAISGLLEVDPSAVQQAFRRTMRTAFLLVGLLSVLGVPAFASLVPSVYGAPFAASASMFVALSFSAGLLVAGAPVYAFVMGRLAARTMLVINVVALAVDVAAALSLIPMLGAWGAVIANVAGALTQLGLLLSTELRSMHMSWREMLLIGRPLIISIVVCLVVYQGARGASVPVVLTAVASSVVATLVWGLMLRMTRSGLTSGDAAALERAVPGRLRRPVLRVLVWLTV